MNSLFNIDLLGFIAELRRTTKFFQWVSTIFQITLSNFVTFCGVTGGKLAAGTPPAIAIGWGLSAMATITAVWFGIAAVTNGMILVTPESLAEAETKANVSITRRNF